MAKELDCRGLQCPEPVVRCRQLLRESTAEEVMIIVDNAAALENVCRFLSHNGYSTSSEQAGPAEWQIKAVRESPAATGDACETACEGKTLVLITSENLGVGDDALGAKLMETFLSTLPELGESLWRVILLNGGVKLAARDGAALECLKKLAQSGVGIFVCGTCLMHYGLMECKQVGETTNMMDIMTSLSLAQKVIRP